MTNIQVPADVLTTAVKYVEVSSLMAKKALDEIGASRAATEKAAALVPPVVKHMLASRVIPPDREKTASDMLMSHEGALQLLKAAVDKIVELQTLGKQAGDNGVAVDPNASGVTAGGSFQKAGEYDSLTSPMVGQRTSLMKASDRALLGMS